MTDEQDVIAYLTSKGIQTYRAAGLEVTAHCFIDCGDGDPKGKGKFYVNTESWLWDCKRCGAQGNRKTLLERFGDEDEAKYVAATDPMLRRRLLGEAADLAHEMLLANESKMQYLLDRGISGELIVQERLGYVPKNIGISEMLPSRESLKGYVELMAAGLVGPSGREFFNDCFTIPYHSHGTVVQVRAKFEAGKYLTTAGDHVRLHNADALFGADQVLITEGEFDDMAVRSALAEANDRDLEGLAVVGLAGAGSWPDGLIEMLAGAKRVFIGLDPDETGNKFADKLVAEIGNRARKVNLPSGEPKTDWTDFLKPKTPKNPHGGHGWRDIHELLVEADLAGKQMFSITDIALKWERRQSEAPGLKLGWTSMDAIIRPGLKPGQVMVPLAKTGTGKTVWLNNLAHNLLLMDKNVLTISLEMTAPEIFEHMRRLHRFWKPKATREELLHDYARLQVTERNRIGRGDLGDLIHEYQDTTGNHPDVVILDYLQYYARGFAGGSMYDRVSDAIMETKAVAKEESVPLVIPSQVSRKGESGKPLLLDDARDAGTIEETADFIPSLFRPDQLVNRDAPADAAPPVQTGVFKAQWLKSRHGGVNRVCDFRFSSMSLAIVDSLDRGAIMRVEQENARARRGEHYDDLRSQQDAQLAQDPLFEGAPA